MASLVEQGTTIVLVELLKVVPTGTKLAEACLCALRSIFQHPPAPIGALPADMRLLGRLTGIFLHIKRLVNVLNFISIKFCVDPLYFKSFMIISFFQCFNFLSIYLI